MLTRAYYENGEMVLVYDEVERRFRIQDFDWLQVTDMRCFLQDYIHVPGVIGCWFELNCLEDTRNGGDPRHQGLHPSAPDGIPFSVVAAQGSAPAKDRG